VSHNKLDGILPEALSRLTNLEALRMQVRLNHPWIRLFQRLGLRQARRAEVSMHDPWIKPVQRFLPTPESRGVDA
jgi:hypothetical protein